MEVWEKFEIECTDYLNQRFGDYARFEHQGGADSTVPDILVETKSGNTFYIDVKHSPAQCGQFVLLPNIETNTFEYSKRNVNRINAYTRKIMAHMEGEFERFREAGTVGRNIELENGSSIFSDWIIQTYQEKGTEFFITNNHTLLPIKRFQDYFEVSAKYRIKRSGSSSVGRRRISSVLNYVESHDYEVTSSYTEGGKLFVESKNNLDNMKFILQQYEYMFSKHGEQYEVRKLSNTYNANVIFSIKKKENISGLSDSEFIDVLKR